MKFRKLTTLEEALRIREIRNESRQFLTNNTEFITEDQQIQWFSQYSEFQNSRSYFVWIGSDEAGNDVGYGAIKIIGDQNGAITLCLGEKFRGMGFGRKLLSFLVDRCYEFNLIPYSEILASNTASINLHKTSGFTELEAMGGRLVKMAKKRLS